MEICFVLPRYVLHPIGGYKIVYEYANRLSQNPNYKVKILFLNKTALANKKLPVFIKNKLINHFTKCGPNWFKLDKKVERISLTQNNGSSIPLFHKLLCLYILFINSELIVLSSYIL